MDTQNLDAALDGVARILIDTSALIAFHNQYERAHLLAVHIMDRIERVADPLSGYYSAISAAEILVRPIKTGFAEFTHMQAFLTSFPNLSAIAADLAIASQAATIRAITRIAIGDAFIIATGIVCGCEAIVSNDDQWKKKLASLFPALKWLYLGDYL